MSTPSFIIRQADGKTIGPVLIHGAGGPIGYDARMRIETAIRRATNGQPLVGIYEPASGFVRCYPEGGENTESDGRIDLRGATLVLCEET